MQAREKEIRATRLTLHSGSTSILQLMTDKNRQAERRWAMVRIVLGMLQTTGAAALVILLISSGVSTLSIAVAVVTTGFLAVSLLLFRGK